MICVVWIEVVVIMGTGDEEDWPGGLYFSGFY